MARVSIDDRFVDQLQALLGDSTPARITEDALTLLSWAAGEVKNGRTIFSANNDATDIRKLAMPALAKLSS